MFAIGALAVHPRACGEHMKDEWLTPPAIGSSPRLRGTRRCRGSGTWRWRFIPAPAGNTPLRPRYRARCTVHPRACGEHVTSTDAEGLSTGSSPRLRGTLPAGVGHGQRQRFIPAPAGNTFRPNTRRHTGTVHPRACGEHELPTGDSHITRGSSPRLRGTPGASDQATRGERFIPAPAGNTGSGEGPGDGSAVHPRACGEHGRTQGGVVSSTGSSPRLRGTRRLRDIPRGRNRFIPAPAGNTVQGRSIIFFNTVHPRACGEHEEINREDVAKAGSSPRLRGTRTR